MEEWRHWLEGSVPPFVIWTDHRNLEYIHTARCLNSRFNFSITFRPGNRTTKPEALSHHFAPEKGDSTPDTILPAPCILGAVTWEIERVVREAQQIQPEPKWGRPNRLFVPLAVRIRVLRWANDSRLSGHPSIRWTLSRLRHTFWWSSHEDTRAYVLACTTCARNKASRRPLPVPHRQWSHLAVDFVYTGGGPVFEGRSCHSPGQPVKPAICLLNMELGFTASLRI